MSYERPTVAEKIAFANFFRDNYGNPQAVYSQARAWPTLRPSDGSIHDGEFGEFLNKGGVVVWPLLKRDYIAAMLGGFTDWAAFQRASDKWNNLDDAAIKNALSSLEENPLAFFTAAQSIGEMSHDRIAFVLDREPNDILSLLMIGGEMFDSANMAILIANSPVIPPNNDPVNQYGMTAAQVADYEAMYRASGYIGSSVWESMTPAMRAAIMSGNIDVTTLTEGQRAAIPSALVMYGVVDLEDALDGGVLPAGYGTAEYWATTQPVNEVSYTDAQLRSMFITYLRANSTDVYRLTKLRAQAAASGVTDEQFNRVLSGITAADLAATTQPPPTYDPDYTNTSTPPSNSGSALKIALTVASLYSLLS